MDTLYLPYLTGDDTVREALDALRSTDRRATVIRRQEGDYRLYRNRELLEAWRGGVKRCGDLDNSLGEKLLVLNSLGAHDQINWPVSETLDDVLQQHLTQRKTRYGVLYPPRAEADTPSPQARRLRMSLVVSQHEGDTYAIMSLDKVCACNPNQHPKDCPPDWDGEQCDDCNEGRYECY